MVITNVLVFMTVMYTGYVSDVFQVNVPFTFTGNLQTNVQCTELY